MKSINLIELLMKKLENAINLDKLITNMKAIFKISKQIILLLEEKKIIIFIPFYSNFQNSRK